MLLTSLQNPKIKYAKKLRNRRFREKENKTILEGYRELSRSFEYGMQIEECFYCPEMYLGENEDSLIQNFIKNDIKVYEVPSHILEKIAYRDKPEGLIAIAKTQKHSLEDIPIKKNGLYLIVEGIEKPGNLGSLLRSADAAGADGLIICNKCTDIYNPNVIRASTGALFAVPIAEATNEEALTWVNENKIITLAGTPHTDYIYSDYDMTQSLAILVGAEQYGLTDFWMNKSEKQVNIPMLGKIDSLNVATAATILLYEAARQRDWK